MNSNSIPRSLSIWFRINKYSAKIGKFQHNITTRMQSVSVKYLNQDEATALDQELFHEYKYSVDQLMELAGLSCASAIRKAYDPKTHNKVLVVCGPGNNGGDGLVAARHLAMMGFTPEIFYPKRTANTLYENLTHQCIKHRIHFLDNCPTSTEINSNYKIVLDALFGFSFKPPIRESMLPIMTALGDSNVDCCCVDIPSGWDVNNGPPSEGPIIKPSLLISLSAPKLCAKFFKGKHYLGGRFIPPGIIEKYQLNLPSYAEADQVVLISDN